MARQMQILRYPRLDTILMVEEFIRKHGGEFKKFQIWQRLPKKMMYKTFCVIFQYLLDTNKIAVDKKGHVCWIWDPEGVRKLLEEKSLFIR